MVKLVSKLEERKGETNGRQWQFGMYLAETLDSQPLNIVFDVSNNERNRLLQFDNCIGKIVLVSFDIAARKTQEGRWFNTVRAYAVKEVNHE